MVARTFVAFDNDNFEVTSSTSAGLVGNGVINNSSTPNDTIFLYSAGSGEDIIVEDAGGSQEVLEDDDDVNHVITDGAGLVADGQTVEAESLIFVRALDGNGDPTGPVITITVFSQGGSVSDVWGLSTDTPLVDGTSYIKTGGSNAGSSRYDSFITCFAAGTPIDTPDGPKLIEGLGLGDLVNTRDNGVQPIRWAGQCTVVGRGNMAPIRIDPGLLGNSDVLLVSPEHRMIVEGPMVELLFGMSCTLVAAKYLVGLEGITQEDVASVTYHHLLFDMHQIIRGAGCWSESFFLAENALSGLDADAQRELFALFPDIQVAQANFGSTAERVLKKHEANLLKSAIQKAVSNGTPISTAA